MRLSAHERRLELDLARGDHAAVLAELVSLLGDNPLNERLRGQLMLALYRSDRQSDALRVYREGRRLLVSQLGVEPSPSLRRLEELILQQDPKLDAVPGVTGLDSTAPPRPPAPSPAGEPSPAVGSHGTAGAFFGRGTGPAPDPGAGHRPR